MGSSMQLLPYYAGILSILIILPTYLALLASLAVQN